MLIEMRISGDALDHILSAARHPGRVAWGMHVAKMRPTSQKRGIPIHAAVILNATRGSLSRLRSQGRIIGLK